MMATVKTFIGNIKGTKGDKGDTGPMGPQGPRGEQGPAGEIDASSTVAFTEANIRTNIESGDPCGTIFGKIKKWFADLKGSAFCGVSNDLTTTVAGNVLDARQGKVLADEIGDTSTLATAEKTVVGAVNELFNGVSYNRNFLSGMEFGYDGANAFFIDFKVKTGNIARLIIRDTGLTYAYFNNGEWLTVWTK